VTCTARALIRPCDPTAITTGGTVNLPAGKVTVFSTTPPFGAACGCSSHPATTSPDMTPLRPSVTCPPCPAPPPRTLNVPDADSNTDDSASGKLFVSDGEFVEAQSTGSTRYSAFDCPAKETHDGRRYSATEGVVGFFAKEGVM